MICEECQVVMDHENPYGICQRNKDCARAYFRRYKKHRYQTKREQVLQEAKNHREGPKREEILEKKREYNDRTRDHRLEYKQQVREAKANPPPAFEPESAEDFKSDLLKKLLGGYQ